MPRTGLLVRQKINVQNSDFFWLDDSYKTLVTNVIDCSLTPFGKFLQISCTFLRTTRCPPVRFALLAATTSRS
jgi:hypothetical protein